MLSSEKKNVLLKMNKKINKNFAIVIIEEGKNYICK